MTNNDACEIAYKNGYEQGLKDAVKHGRWEWMTEDMYNCTYCGTINHVKEVMGRPDFNYCPNCGARMDGET